jgi:predicted XRE-type DNA-binding protein
VLARSIAAIVKRQGWTQTEAARRCGVTQPRMNDLLRGSISRFSLDALVNMAAYKGPSLAGKQNFPQTVRVRFDLGLHHGREFSLVESIVA